MPASTPTSRPTRSEILGEVSDCRRSRSYYKGLSRFILDFTLYWLALLGTCTLPLDSGAIIFAIIAGILLGRLFVLAHDAAHDALTPARRLNHAIARFLFTPALVPLSRWIYSHNYLHHACLRIKGKDMVWQPWSYQEYRDASRAARFWYRFLRSPFGLGFYWIVEVWLRHQCWPRSYNGGRRWKAFLFDCFCLAASFVLIYGGLWLASDRLAARLELPRPTPWGIIIWAFLVPYLIWTYSIGWVDLVQHTHPRSAWFKDRSDWSFYQSNVQSTTRMILPFRMEFSLHHILTHTAHHIDPRIPLYELEPAQRSIEHAHGEDVIVAKLTPGYVLWLLKNCRLYDFERHCWLDYDGSPTTEPVRPSRSVRRTR